MRKTILYFSPLLILCIFFSFLLFGVRNHSQSHYFQDETEHVFLGWMIQKYQLHLYSDISTNHQPLPILFGAVLSDSIPHNSFFQFIDRLRVSMWFFAFISSIAITVRFRWRGLLATTLCYSLGHYFFAWHVLAESIAAPAVLWILLSCFETLFIKINHSKIDSLLFGLSSFVILFCLLPLWPFVATANMLYLLGKSTQLKAILIASLLFPSLLLGMFIEPTLWFQETIINNLLYFIPYETHTDTWHYLKLVFYPLQHVIAPHTVIAKFYSGVVMLLIIIGYTHSLNRQKLALSSWKKLLLFFTLLVLLNLRISESNATFFNGFHLLPYVAGISTLLSVAVLSLPKKLIRKHPSIIFGLGTGILLLFVNNLLWILEIRDKQTDYYVQYDTFQAYGTALKTISIPGDTLMTGPDGSGYININANLPISGKQNFHLEWAYRVGYLREAWLHTLQQNPPTFIYFFFDSNSYSQILLPKVESEYIVLRRSDGSPTHLYMLKSAIPKVTSQQWKNFEDQAFQKPTL